MEASFKIDPVDLHGPGPIDAPFEKEPVPQAGSVNAGIFLKFNRALLKPQILLNLRSELWA